jgi:hypothetical protein
VSGSLFAAYRDGYLAGMSGDPAVPPSGERAATGYAVGMVDGRLTQQALRIGGMRSATEVEVEVARLLDGGAS